MGRRTHPSGARSCCKERSASDRHEPSPGRPIPVGCWKRWRRRRISLWRCSTWCATRAHRASTDRRSRRRRPSAEASPSSAPCAAGGTLPARRCPSGVHSEARRRAAGSGHPQCDRQGRATSRAPGPGAGVRADLPHQQSRVPAEARCAHGHRRGKGASRSRLPDGRGSRSGPVLRSSPSSAPARPHRSAGGGSSGDRRWCA